MFKLMGYAIKTIIFSVIVLVAGNLITIGDRTLSDHVRTGITGVKDAGIPEKINDWAKSQPAVPTERAERMKKAPANNQAANSKNLDDASSDEITPSERRKLKALIAEMNR